jgi:hypothetical protein
VFVLNKTDFIHILEYQIILYLGQEDGNSDKKQTNVMCTHWRDLSFIFIYVCLSALNQKTSVRVFRFIRSKM